MDTLSSPVSRQFSHIGPPPLLNRKKSVRPEPTRNNESSLPRLQPIRNPETRTSSPAKKTEKVPTSYLRKLNLGLSFDADAVYSSAPGALDYSQINRDEVFAAPGDVISPAKKRPKGSLGRHNAIGDPILHLPCTLTIPEYSAKMRRSRQFCTKPFLKNTTQERSQEESIAAQLSTTTTSAQWDEFVLNKLSSETAGFIVNKHASGVQRDRLQRKVLGEGREEVESIIFRDSQFMPVEPIITDRKAGVEEDSCKTSMASFSMSEIEKDIPVEEEIRKEEEEEEYIPKYIGKPLTKNYMERFMSKAQRKREIGVDPEQDKFVSSQYNRNVLASDFTGFTEDILQGRTSIHNPLTQSTIVFDPQTKYRKALISCYPQKPQIWGPKPQAPSKAIRPLPKRGNRPWKEYPKLIITTYQRQVLDSISDSESEKETVPGFSVQDFMESDTVNRSLLMNALTTWRTTWYLDNKWRDSNIESILEDFTDISEHVKITAAIACGAGIGYRDDWVLEEPVESTSGDDEAEVPISGYRTYSPSEPAAATQRGYQPYDFDGKRKEEEDSSMTNSVVDGLRKLVSDKSERVRVAAAVTLLTIGASNEKANTVLLDALQSAHTMEADSWAAVQCLAMENVTERIVIDKLIDSTQSIDQLIRHIATKLLVRLSQCSDVILFMVADELNNKLWTNRYMACKVIQKIKTPLNKDILHKLLTVMWSDYNEDNKSVAAQTIGIKGHGHILHEELCCRLRNGSEYERVDALERIVELKMMTGRMKSAFIKCFTDDHVSVRLTASRGAGQLKFADKEIIDALLLLISDDHAWKVKATAIEALAEIDVVTDDLIKQLVWSAQYQKNGQVRAAACTVLAMLNITNEEVVNTLRDRLTADADIRVKKASTDALLMLGMKPEKDASLIVAIKEAVKKLGTKDAILASIIKSDNASSSSELNSAGSDGLEVHVPKASTIMEVIQMAKSKSRGQSREKNTADNKQNWPDAKQVIEVNEKITKAEKIQALLKSHEPQEPNTGFTWKIT